MQTPKITRFVPWKTCLLRKCIVILIEHDITKQAIDRKYRRCIRQILFNIANRILNHALDDGFLEITTAAEKFHDVEMEVAHSVSEQIISAHLFPLLKCQTAHCLIYELCIVVEENFKNVFQTFELLQNALNSIRKP